MVLWRIPKYVDKIAKERMVSLEYFFSPEIFMSGFPVPVKVVDEYIKLAGASQLKVLLFLLRHHTEGIDLGKAAEALGMDFDEVQDALRFWVQAGIILTKGDAIPKTAEKKKAAPAIRPRGSKPSREEVAQRGLEDPAVVFLLKEAELRFGRVLKSNEMSTLVWLYDDEGLSIPVIIMLLEFAVAENACNISFIERTALKWVDKGVTEITDAEEEIKELQKGRSAWRQVQRAFGIEKRMPSANELKLACLWVYDYGFGAEILRAAYDACVDSISKFDMKYIKGILDNWHKNGVKSVEDIDREKVQKPATKLKGKKSSAMNTTDMDWAEKMLQTGGKE